MIEISNHWTDEVKSVANQINKAISSKDANMAKSAIIKLMKMVNQDKNKDIKLSAAWCISELSEKHSKMLKPAISILDQLLDDVDTLVIGHAINALANLMKKFPDKVSLSIPKIAKCLDSFDPGLRRNTLIFFRNLAEETPEFIKSEPEALREIKLTSNDLDRSIANIAKEILKMLD